MNVGGRPGDGRNGGGNGVRSDGCTVIVQERDSVNEGIGGRNAVDDDDLLVQSCPATLIVSQPVPDIPYDANASRRFFDSSWGGK